MLFLSELAMSNLTCSQTVMHERMLRMRRTMRNLVRCTCVSINPSLVEKNVTNFFKKNRDLFVLKNKYSANASEKVPLPVDSIDMAGTLACLSSTNH